MTLQMIKELEMRPRLEELKLLEEVHVGGTTHIDDEVIGAIAGVAAGEVDGVSSLGTSSIRRAIAERFGSHNGKSRGVSVEAGRREAILDVDLKVIYGYSIPEMAVKARRMVALRVLELCGLITKEININVIGIDFPSRMPGRVQ